MAFRRRRVNRRAPVRRYRSRVARRRLSRRPRRRRGRTSGKLTFLCRNTHVVEVTGGLGLSVPIAPTLQTFDEVSPFYNNFEAYRIWGVNVKVTPQFNISDPGTGVANYYSAPWHKEATGVTITTNSIQSIDRCKSYHGCKTTVRNFVPAIMAAVGTTGDGVTVGKTSWRPRLEFHKDSHKIPHYCALYYFSPNQVAASAANKYMYEIQITARVTLYNQNKGLF